MVFTNSLDRFLKCYSALHKANQTLLHDCSTNTIFVTRAVLTWLMTSYGGESSVCIAYIAHCSHGASINIQYSINVQLCAVSSIHHFYQLLVAGGRH